MPFKISIRTDFERAARALDDLQRKQLPYATAAALTDTAQAARQRITAALPTIFDRPVPFTLNALAIKPATKASLTSEVFVRPIQGKYLLPEELGGERVAENNTRSPGAPFSVPGKIGLDASGNIPNGAIKALGELAKPERQVATTAEGKKALRRRKALASKIGRKGAVGVSIAYFKGAGPHDRGPGGFFERLPDHELARLTAFETVSHYKPIFRFRERVQLIARQTFRVALMRRLREALATAK